MDDQVLLEELGQFPLLDAMFGRRSRRFGVGMTIPDGPLAYSSTQPPLPLTDLERTVLVLCGAGVSGWHLGMEHTANGDPDRGCNYPVRLTGRVAASAAGIETSELIVSDDSGTFITRFRDLDPTGGRAIRAASDLETFVARVGEHCLRLSDYRVELPAAAPHISAHTLWNANRPGTTLFIPIIDMTQQVLDFLAIYLAGGIIPWDPIRDCPCSDLDRFVASGLLDARKRMSLVDIEQYMLATGAIELGLICQNIVLTLQAIGLGGWMYTGINPPSLLGAYAGDGITGLGFRFTCDPAWTMPNPVGLDGVFEGYCPPYYPDMRSAVARFNELKFGPGGAYDPARPGPFRENARIKGAYRAVQPRVHRHARGGGAVPARHLWQIPGDDPEHLRSDVCPGAAHRPGLLRRVLWIRSNTGNTPPAPRTVARVAFMRSHRAAACGCLRMITASRMSTNSRPIRNRSTSLHRLPRSMSRRSSGNIVRVDGRRLRVGRDPCASRTPSSDLRLTPATG